MEQHDVIILGSGPAGYTAALYAARAQLAPVLIDGNQPGGQLTITTDVENYPGFPEGVMGPEMMDLFRRQAQRFGTTYVTGEVVKADLSKRPFVLTLDDGREYSARALIICTGARAKLLGLENESKLMGFGVSACATCDGFFFREKEVVVVGGGDTAMEEATFLTRYATKVTIIHRRESLRASKIMQEKAQKNPKIEFLWNHTVVEVHDPAQKKVTGLTLENTVDGSRREFKTDGLFIGIGHEPNSGPFKGQLDMNELGYLLVKDPSTATNISGVFAAGDVADHVYRQAVTAAGTGCRAAIDAERFLEAEGH
jgi:thioredoxin reductase (NADPH)